jgi:hypothetical protein
MGFLSQVAHDNDAHAPPEDGNETFYGTVTAKHDVCAYKMGEDEVSQRLCNCVVVDLTTRKIPTRNAYQYIEDQRGLQLFAISYPWSFNGKIV